MRSHVALLAALAFAPRAGLAQWTALPNPEGDPIQVFLTAPEALYVGTYLGNVYRTSDLGETWTEVGGGLDHATPVDALARVEDWLIAARSSWGGTHRCAITAGVCSAWQAIPDPGGSFSGFAVIGPRVFGVLGSELAVSEDHGWSWDPLPLPSAAGATSVFSVGQTLFATGDSAGDATGGMFRSEDFGQSWDPVAGIGAEVRVVASTTYGGLIVVSSYAGLQNTAIYRSADDGVTWSQVSPLPNDYPANGLATSNGWLAAGFAGEDASGDTIYLTSDLTDWEPFTSGLPSFARSVARLAAREGSLFKTGGTVTTYRAPVPASPMLLFADGFETGDTTAWSATVP